MKSASWRASPAFSSFRILFATACLPLAAIACSAGGETADTGGAGGASSGTMSSGTGTNGTGASTGSSTSTTGVGGGFNPTVGSSGAGGSQSCAGTTADAQLAPVAMFIAIDRSGSMSGTKWTSVQTAFPQFWQDPSAKNLVVALRFWPTSDGCDDPQCSATVCSQPKVGPGSLSDANFTQQLISTLQSTSPTGITPTSAALDGATKWAANYMIQNPGQKAVVLLVTDGDPTACNTSSSAIYNIATNAYQSANVLTFAIGMQGANQTFLSGLAQAGGTTKEYMIGSTNTVQDLLNALKAIQGSTISCDIAMPDAPPGKKIDPAQVEVIFTPNGGTPVKITQVANLAACGPNGGFYYDDPAAPTKLTLCPATCSAVQSVTDAKLEVNMGCLTDIN